MELRYMGFEQHQNTRTYRFDRVEQCARTGRFTVSADLGLFLRLGIAIQEGPVLCAKKLAANLAGLHTDSHSLTNDDLLAFIVARKPAPPDKLGKWERRAAA
jgi:hypothetical protein